MHRKTIIPLASRSAVVAAAALALALGLSACALGATSGAGSTTATSTVPASSASIATSTSAPSTSVPIGNASSAAALCAESQLKASVDTRHIPGNGTMDLHGRTQQGIYIVFRNTSTSSCVLYGYPGAATTDAKTHRIQQAERTLRGQLGGLPQAQKSPAHVTLAPGADALSLIEGVDQLNSKGDCKTTSPRILVTPPNTRVPVPFTFALSGCSSFTVHPVQKAGAPASSAVTTASVTRTQALANAASYATARGYRIGIAVYDTRTRKSYGQNSGDTFPAESVVKTMISARLLQEGHMHGDTADRAYKMITRSDDAAASGLYRGVGGDKLLSWVKKTYDIANLGAGPSMPGWWGKTRITPMGLVNFYAKIKDSDRVGSWLLDAMHHATSYGSDGVYQGFGIPAVTKGAAIKQGWGDNYQDAHPTANYNTTGFIDDDRYAVAILSSGPRGSYGAPMAKMLTEVARRLLPGGHVPDPAPSVSSVDDDHGSAAGGTRVTIRGHDLTHVTAVYFGDTAATAVKMISSTKLKVTAPAHLAGKVSIRVVTGHGGSSRKHARSFTFRR